MMVSSVEPWVMQGEGENVLLRFYFEELKSGVQGSRAEFMYGWEEFVEHYDLCVLDLVRFLAGWGLWGNTEFVLGKMRVLMNKYDL